MKVLVTGKNGQLGWELAQCMPDNMQLFALDSSELDISDEAGVDNTIARIKPDLVINTAAYTAVDKAEQEQEKAYAVNALGPQYIAQACLTHQARLLHISTDFIFDGSKTTPYQTDDEANPLGIYGASKWAGEVAVRAILPEALIVRTAWVYSSHGHNFVKTMLRLMGEKPQLGIVYDQIGTPCWAAGLAKWLWAVAHKPAVSGTFHWTDAGIASWYDFAVAIQELAMEKGMLHTAIEIRPIPATAYPTPARRPSLSVLDKTSAEQAGDIVTRHWRAQLSDMLDRLNKQPGLIG
ncbi:MAG: dTDP-4-dehydrorhamnose reductase [Paraglaciecola sp.]|jgi:dTDP-4-dehydrorhamnose reductase